MDVSVLINQLNQSLNHRYDAFFGMIDPEANERSKSLEFHVFIKPDKIPLKKENTTSNSDVLESVTTILPTAFGTEEGYGSLYSTTNTLLMQDLERKNMLSQLVVQAVPLPPLKSKHKSVTTKPLKPFGSPSTAVNQPQ